MEEEKERERGYWREEHICILQPHSESEQTLTSGRAQIKFRNQSEHQNFPSLLHLCTVRNDNYGSAALTFKWEWVGQELYPVLQLNLKVNIVELVFCVRSWTTIYTKHESSWKHAEQFLNTDILWDKLRWLGNGKTFPITNPVKQHFIKQINIDYFPPRSICISSIWLKKVIEKGFSTSAAWQFDGRWTQVILKLRN